MHALTHTHVQFVCSQSRKGNCAGKISEKTKMFADKVPAGKRPRLKSERECTQSLVWWNVAGVWRIKRAVPRLKNMFPHPESRGPWKSQVIYKEVGERCLILSVSPGINKNKSFPTGGALCSQGSPPYSALNPLRLHWLTVHTPARTSPLSCCRSRLGKPTGTGNCELWNWIMSWRIHWSPYCLSDALENSEKREYIILDKSNRTVENRHAGLSKHLPVGALRDCERKGHFAQEKCCQIDLTNGKERQVHVNRRESCTLGISNMNKSAWKTPQTLSVHLSVPKREHCFVYERWATLVN